MPSGDSASRLAFWPLVRQQCANEKTDGDHEVGRQGYYQRS